MRYPAFLISSLLLLSLHVQAADAAILYSVPVEVPARIIEETPWPVSVQGDGGVLFGEAVGNYSRGHYQEAIAQFADLTRGHPKSEAARVAILWLGSLYFKMAMQEGKRDARLLMSALESFQENVRNDSNPTDTPLVLMEIGKIYREMNLMEESKGSFKRVIKEYPSAGAGYAPAAQYQLALTYELEGDFREAVSAYHVLALRYPGKMEGEGVFGTGRALFALHEDLLIRIAEVHQKLLLHQEASYIYQKVIDRNGAKKELALFKAGELYANTGDPARAVETLGRYIAGYPTGERTVKKRSDAVLSDVVNRFREIPVNGLLFTKLNEAERYGSVFNMRIRAQRPLSYFTTGPRVPEDIELAAPERLCRLILGMDTVNSHY